MTLDVDEEGGLAPGYRLKLNSYDLGVDIELADALNRIRFEHPEVRVVVFTSAAKGVFCSGANIYMLGLASHAQKVNFCKFTNETRNGIEDSSAHSGIKFLAAIKAPAPAAVMNWRSPAMRSSWLMIGQAPSACRRWRCSGCCPVPVG